jgi:hypothetical protein
MDVVVRTGPSFVIPKSFGDFALLAAVLLYPWCLTILTVILAVVVAIFRFMTADQVSILYNSVSG